MPEPDKTVLTALAAAHAELPAISKDKTNPAYKSKYAGLDTIIEAVTPVLTKHDLVWYALPGLHPDTGVPVLNYTLAHTSGDQLTGTMPLLVKADATPQQLGSALTYARRYAITAVLNLATEDDDDGNAAGQQSRAGAPGGTITSKQQGLLHARAKAKGWKPDDLLQAVRVITGATSVEEMPIGAMDAVLAQIDSGYVPADQRTDVPADPDDFKTTPPPDPEDVPF